jgi:hypothetical protein
MVANCRVRSPDGREWQISVIRFKLPGWPQSNYEPADQGGSDPFDFILYYLILGPIFWIVIPLFRASLMTPVALVRGLFSSVRWIEVEVGFPAVIKMVWRTSKERADEAAEHIASKLAVGYEQIAPEWLEFVSMTEPLGLRDRDS